MAAPSFLMRRGEAPSIIIQLLRHHYFASSLRPHSDGLSRSLIFRPRRSEILFSDGAGKTGNFHGGGVANLSTTAMKKGGGILHLADNASRTRERAFL